MMLKTHDLCKIHGVTNNIAAPNCFIIHRVREVKPNQTGRSICERAVAQPYQSPEIAKGLSFPHRRKF